MAVVNFAATLRLSTLLQHLPSRLIFGHLVRWIHTYLSQFLTSPTLQTFALDNKHFPGSHTAEKILEALEKCMEEWGLPVDIPIFCVRDNGSNIKAAIRGSTWYDVSCFAHTLQLAISYAIRNEDGMEHMLKKCKQIVSHYHHSSLAGGRIDKYHAARSSASRI